MSDYRVFAGALRTILERDALRRKLMNRETTEEACKELRVDSDMAEELKQVLMAIPSLPVNPPIPGSTHDEAATIRSKTLSSIDKAQEFLDSSFGQLRTAYRVSLVMSVSLFAAGMVFLAIAAIRSFTHPEAITGTVVAAGIGVVQIVALFYRNPLRDVGRAVSNAQQSKMAIMSYMLGVSLVGESVYHSKQTDEAIRRLGELTHGAVQQLEQFAEGQTKGKAGVRKAKRGSDLERQSGGQERQSGGQI